MMKNRVVVGVDGCPGGWITVTRRKGGLYHVDIFSEFGDIPISQDSVVAVDMPIGLPDTGRRGCDELARSMLGRYGARVFLDLRRPLLDEALLRDYGQANSWAKKDGHGLSRQAHAILPKIKMLDDWITPDRQAVVREAHPELAFARLNRNQPLPNKKKSEGRSLRLKLLEEQGFSDLESQITHLERKRAAPDDLLDACAMALTASRIAAGDAHRLSCEKFDSRHLKMEIWY